MKLFRRKKNMMKDKEVVNRAKRIKQMRITNKIFDLLQSLHGTTKCQ
jgi:hypothetical protein